MLRYFARKYSFFASLSTSLKSLILSSFLVAFGSFMVTPFLAIFLEHSVGMNIHAIGRLVAVATFIQFGGGVLGGVVADRFGLKLTMVSALTIRTLGFFLLAVASSFPAVVIPAVLLGAVGPALYLPANKAYIVSSVTAELKPLFLSISNAALNAGMALGPLLAALLINDKPAMLFLGITLLFVVITAVHQVTLSPVTPFQAPVGRDTSRRLPEIVRRVWRPALFNTMTFYAYFHFQNFMGLYTASISGVRVFGWVMLLNFVLMFTLQPPLAGAIARADYRNLLAGSFLLMALGMMVMTLGNTPAILLGTAIMTIGELFLFLRGDLEIVARLPDQPAVAFGIQRLTAGVGGLLSGILGGSVFAHYKGANTLGRFWFVVAAQCALAAVLSLAFARVKPGAGGDMRKPREHQTEPTS